MRRIMARSAIGGVLAAAALSAAPAAGGDDPLTRPLEPEAAAAWLTPQAPIHLYGNSYLVGFGGLNVALIRTSAGLILIDGALPQAVHSVEAHIRSLGFRVRDVKYILSTEPHFDHAGGIAALARDSGATVIASAAGARALAAGHNLPGDPQFGFSVQAPPVRQVRVIADGETVRLGDTVVTARAMPGHTPGSMSWTWRSCEAGRCLAMVFGASLNPISADAYRFSDPAHRSIVAAFRSTFARFAALPCDILVTSHPGQSGGDLKRARFDRAPRPNPFIDPKACRNYARASEKKLDARIAQERASRKD